MNVQFIGVPSHQLLCTFHPAIGRWRSPGVVLAPPIGTEYLRSHWAFRRLASQLTRAGFPVMRVDYRGTGDSSQNAADIHDLRIWQEDLCTAADALRKQSGCERLALVGLRLGAAIAIQAAQHIENLQQIIAWEPILDGQRYLECLRRMQTRMLDLWNTPVQSIHTATHEEILGTVYSKGLLQQIAAIRIDPATLHGPSIDLVSDTSRTTNTMDEIVDNEAARWDDLRFLEIAWLPKRCLKQIIDHLERKSISS